MQTQSPVIAAEDGERRTICVASMRNASSALKEMLLDMGVDLWLSTKRDETVDVKSVMILSLVQQDIKVLC